MNNRKAEKRKKLLAERAARRRTLTTRQAERGQYPDFKFDERNGNPAFVELVREAVEDFRFDQLPAHERETYKLVRSHGAVYAREQLRLAMAEIEREGGERGRQARMAELAWVVNLGEAIFGMISRDRLLEHIPHNDVRFAPHGNSILVEFNSLLRASGTHGTVWYSRRRPAVEIDGCPYIVAFSKHAMDRVCERLKQDWTTYAALGDVYAYFDRCVYFEPVTLHGDQLAFTFFDLCLNQFVSYWYVLDVLGEENLDPSKGRPYYRVGYCPAVIENGFLKAKTLLFPGYTSTPEYGAVLRSRLPRRDRDSLLDQATRLDAKTLYQSVENMAPIRWFHENGVTQVIQTSRTVFSYA